MRSPAVFLALFFVTNKLVNGVIKEIIIHLYIIALISQEVKKEDFQPPSCFCSNSVKCAHWCHKGCPEALGHLLVRLEFYGHSHLLITAFVSLFTLTSVSLAFEFYMHPWSEPSKLLIRKVFLPDSNTHIKIQRGPCCRDIINAGERWEWMQYMTAPILRSMNVLKA